MPDCHEKTDRIDPSFYQRSRHGRNEQTPLKTRADDNIISFEDRDCIEDEDSITMIKTMEKRTTLRNRIVTSGFKSLRLRKSLRMSSGH